VYLFYNEQHSFLTVESFSSLPTLAFYGEVSGSIKINGQDTSIKEISDSIGFVPQVSSRKKFIETET